MYAFKDNCITNNMYEFAQKLSLYTTYTLTLQRDRYRDRIVTSCGCVSAFQDTFTVLYSTVMALLRTPVSELVSCTFSTIPISPFLIQRIFHLLVSTPFLLASSKISYMYIHIHDALQTIAALALPTCSKYTSKEGLELLRLLTMELCFVKKSVTGSI